MSYTGLKCLNANFICYATQLPLGAFLCNSEFDFFSFDDLPYKLMQAFPLKHLYRIHQPSGLFFFIIFFCCC